MNVEDLMQILAIVLLTWTLLKIDIAEMMSITTKVIETRFVAYGPLYVKKPPKYWSNLGECF